MEPSSAFCRLCEVLPAAQQEQLAELILHRLASGWGMLEIEFQDHRLKAFREVNSIPARKGEEVGDGEKKNGGRPQEKSQE